MMTLEVYGSAPSGQFATGCPIESSQDISESCHRYRIITSNPSDDLISPADVLLTQLWRRINGDSMGISTLDPVFDFSLQLRVR